MQHLIRPLQSEEAMLLDSCLAPCVRQAHTLASFDSQKEGEWVEEDIGVNSLGDGPTDNFNE